MALDSIQGTEFVRKKIASFKEKSQAADKRTKKAKESYQVIEARFGRTLCVKSKLQEEIVKREVKLERAEALIESLNGKKAVLFRFREETNQRAPVMTEGGQGLRDISLKIATLAKQTKNSERKYNAGVDREHVLLERSERAKKRIVQAESTSQKLQQELASLNHRIQILVERKKSRDALKQRAEALEEKVECAFAKALELENKEAELEIRIIELEDQLEMYKHKGKRISAILADKDDHKSTESWTITLLLRRSSIFNGSSVPQMVSYNSTNTRVNGT